MTEMTDRKEKTALERAEEAAVTLLKEAVGPDQKERAIRAIAEVHGAMALRRLAGEASGIESRLREISRVWGDDRERYR